MRWWFCLGLVLAPSVSRAQSTFFPGEGTWATVMFEDLYPSFGDGDFNDVVLRTHIEKVSDGATIERLVVHVNPQALGASRCNGLGLRIPVPPAAIASATVRVGTAGSWSGRPWGAATPLALGSGSPGYTDAGGETAFWLIDDLRALCPGATGFLNTVIGDPASACASLELDVTFSADPGALATEPFDPFIHRCGDRSWQVHLPGYAGVEPEFDDSLLTRGDVDPASGAFVLHTPAALRGLPFALAVGDGSAAWGDPDFTWPVEQTRIDQAMPDIVPFAQGTGGLTWYRDNTVPGKVYPTSPPLPPVDARGDGSSKTHAALSCATLHRDHDTLGTGVYFVDPNGGDPTDALRVACEMGADGGGYTTLFNVDRTEPQWSLSTTSGTYLHGAGLCGGGLTDSFSCVTELQARGYTPWTAQGQLMWYIDHVSAPTPAHNPWLRAPITGIEDLTALFTHSTACASRCTDPDGDCDTMMSALMDGSGAAHYRWYNAGHSPLVTTYPTCAPDRPALNHVWNADTATGRRCNADFDRVHLYGDRDNGLGYYQNSAPNHNCYYWDAPEAKRHSRMLLREQLPRDCSGNAPANPDLAVFRFAGVIDYADPGAGLTMPEAGENVHGWLAFDPDVPDVESAAGMGFYDHADLPGTFQMVVWTDTACFETITTAAAPDTRITVFDQPSFDRFEAYSWDATTDDVAGWDYTLLSLFLQATTNLDTVTSDAPLRAVPRLEPWDHTAWIYVETGNGGGWSAFGATLTALVDD